MANSNLSGSSPITYYALDLEYRELERTLGDIASSDLGPILKDKVSTRGMWGTYEDGLKFLQSGGLHSPSSSFQMAAMGRHLSREFDSADRDNSPDSRSSASSTDAGSSPPSTPGETQQPLHLLFLGSSLGNFTRAEGAEFLRSLPLRPGMGDTLLLGLDHDNDQRVIEEAYNDPRGHTEAFIVNGLKAAGRVLGDDKLFDGGKWEYVNVRRLYCREHPTDRCHRNMTLKLVRALVVLSLNLIIEYLLGCHEAFFKCKEDYQVQREDALFTFVKDELVKIEQSLKVSSTNRHTNARSHSS